MNKKLLSIIAAAFVTIAMQAQQTYFSTSFDEGIPPTFTLWDMDQNEPSTDMAKLGFAVGKAWIAVADGNDNNIAACSTSWYKKAGTSDDWMILPEITISDSEAQLQWRARAYDKEYRDGYRVLAAIIDGDDVELLPDLFDTANPLFTTSKENQAWTRHEVSLANYVGKTIRIAFVNDSKDKTRLLVDDIFAGVPSTVGLLLDFDRTYDGYGDITISGRAFANLSEPVPSYTIGFEMNGETIEQTFNNELQPGVQVPFQLTGKAHLERNATAEYKAWITAGNDKSEINGKLSAFLWKVVAEEVTGTWCQYCVRGIGAMNYMRENDPDGFIGIAIHNNSSTSCPDSMAIPGEEYRAWIMNNYSMSGYPHCVLNRNAQYSTDPGNIPSYTARIKQSGKNCTGLSLTANYDSAADMISATTDVFFANDYENADFKLAYIVIENDVHRTHAQTGLINQYCGYDQINGYAGGAMGECYGFEELPSIINADNIWYQDVARGYEGTDGYKGKGGLLPKTIADGDSFTHEVQLAMPATVLNKENTELVVMLLSRTGAVVNAEKCPIGIDGSLGIKSLQEYSTKSVNPATYTISGCRVDGKTPLRKGIYIVGGKKVVVK